MPFIILLVIVLALLISNIVIVPQASAYVIERLGTYKTTWYAGLHIKVPFIEKIAKKVSTKEQVLDFAPSSVITSDNVAIQIDSVVYLTFSDPKLLAYGVESPLTAVENLTATTLRNIIGGMDLDHTLTSRDEINGKMQVVLDEATDPWGIKVTRVELKNIMPPRDIQDSMEQAMRAERERRKAVLTAEGHKASQILMAEGEKQSAILRAEAQKQVKLLEAEADMESKIKIAKGEAEAIRLVADAKAEGLQRMKDVNADNGLIRLRSLETLEAMAQGQATKIIVPSELQGMAGTLAGLAETVEKVTPKVVETPAPEPEIIHCPRVDDPSKCVVEDGEE